MATRHGETTDARGREARPVDPAEICTLDEPARRDRLAWIRSEILEHVSGPAESGTDFVVLELDDAPGLATKLDRLVELEAGCCADMPIEHGASGVPGRRWLRFDGVDPERLRRLLSLDPLGPLERGSARGGAVARAVRAAGIGTTLGLAVCCALPLAVGVVAGSAAAASLSWLDQPAVIAAAAFAFGGLAFAWMRMRARDGEVGEGGDCGCS